MSLRRRIEKSQKLAQFLSAIAGSYFSFCNRTTRWQHEGHAELRRALDAGPVLLLVWHERALMGALHWPVADGPISSLFDSSPIGRLAGALHRRSGLQPIEMSHKQSNRAASRVVLKRFREGVSIGMTGDGPLGPARQVNEATLEWARVLGAPIFCYAFATTRGRRLKSWDRMVLPYPFGRGAYVFARFAEDFPRNPSAKELETLREQMRLFMDETTARADTLVGRPGS